MHLILCSILSLVSAAVAAPAPAPTQSGTANLTATLASLNLTEFLGNITANPQISKDYSSLRNVTIFASNNGAYDKLGEGLRNNLKNVTMVQGMFEYVIVNGTYNSSFFVQNSTLLDTHLGSNYSRHNGSTKIKITKQGNNLTVVTAGEQPSNIVLADQAFNGGIIHIIDSIPQYPLSIQYTGDTANLTSILSLAQANFTNPSALAHDVTIFAPSNNVWGPFANQYHTTSEVAASFSNYILNNTVLYLEDIANNMTRPNLNGNNITFTIIGNQTFVNSAPIIRSDILVDVGVIHVLDPEVLEI